MASPKEIAPLLPETLPEDFAEWDGEGSRSRLPGGSNQGEDSYIPYKSPKPPGQPGSHETSSAYSSRLRNTDLSTPAAEIDSLLRTLLDEPSDSQTDFSVEQDRPGLGATGGAQTVRELTANEMREADKVLVEMFFEKNPEVAQKEQPSRKMRVIVPAAAGCAILIALSLLIWSHHGAKAAANRSVEPQPAASNSLETTPPKPAAGQMSTQVQPAASNTAQQTSDGQPSHETDGTASAQAAKETQVRMMNDQLAARSIITRDSTKDPDSSLPSGGLDAAGSDGMATQDAANVFNGHSQPVVKAAPQKPPVISSGVATGMLIHKTPPVYPPAAKAARLSGTVEVHATISKDGTIRDLQAVSGPEVLRQAAVDAVRTWRYKPYELNNEPVEVETTVNVIFSLGG